jgi:phosphopantothenoylcysteine decarboxylase/phosphopantothenate--cysteine ligase
VWLDDVRCLTNKFRGTLGLKIAEEAYLRGANVKLIMGPGGLNVPRFIETERINSFEEYYDAVLKSLGSNGYDSAIFSAAVSDYTPKKKVSGKIPSQGAMDAIEMMNTPKVIRDVRDKFPDLYMVTFKYEEGVTSDELKRLAMGRVDEGYQMVVANRGEEITKTTHNSIIVDSTGVLSMPETKRDTAIALLDALEKSI